MALSRCAVIGLLLWHALGSSLTGEGHQAATDARTHLNDIVAVLEREWLYRDRMDWGRYRERLLERAGDAQTVPETYDAIRFALAQLGDRHTYYVSSAGESIFNPESPTQSTDECTPAPFSAPSLLGEIGYVRVQITPATLPAAIQEALLRGDGLNTLGWIVDLRNSRGGNMWPVVAGLGSLLGEGTAGFFVDASGRATAWGYRNGMAWLGERNIVGVEAPHQMSRPNARVAVLTDIGVASSGEAVAIAFRERPNTRSFGMPTCGLSTAVSQFPLSNGARLGVVVSVMADRTGRQYGGVVEPDELVLDPDEVLTRAVAWLRAAG